LRRSAPCPTRDAPSWSPASRRRRRRTDCLPLSTAAEAAGLNGNQARSGFGLPAPAGAAADIINRIQQTATALVTAPNERLLSQGANPSGMDPSGMPPAESGPCIATETANGRRS
jgi:hypothetical protein